MAAFRMVLGLAIGQLMRGSAAAPAGFVFLRDDDGIQLADADGTTLMEAI